MKKIAMILFMILATYLTAFAEGPDYDGRVDWNEDSPFFCYNFANYENYYPGSKSMGLYATEAQADAAWQAFKEKYGIPGYSYNANFPEFCAGGNLRVKFYPGLPNKWFFLRDSFAWMLEYTHPVTAGEEKAPDNSDFGPIALSQGKICSISPAQVGNPISVLNGNNYEAETDLKIPAGGLMPFEIRRYYNSRSETDGPAGYGWQNNFNAALVPDLFKFEYNYLKIKAPTGRVVYFTDDGDGNYSGLYQEKTTLSKIDNEYIWQPENGERFFFDTNGRNTKIEDALGNIRNLIYDTAGRLVTVSDEFTGRSLTFEYDANDRISQIRGPVTGAVPDGVWVRYGYDANGNLETVTYADNSGFDYDYTDPNDIHNLTVKKNLAGHLISSWTYDTQDRAIHNYSRDGKGVAIDYASEDQINVTDAYGISRSYRIAVVNGRKKLTAIESPTGCTECGTGVVGMTYDTQGQLIEAEYANGRIEKYADFDDRGNPREITEAFGTPEQHTIYQTYHPALNARLSLRRISTLGQGDSETFWDYDNDGNSVANENPTALLYRKIERGFTKDSAGDVVPYEHITVFTYDAQGRVLSIDGPLSGGEDTTVFAYNPANGNLLSVTQPEVGTTAYTQYDAAGLPGRIIDPNGNALDYTYDGKGRALTVTSVVDNATTAFNYNSAGEIASVTLANGVITSFGYDASYGRLVAVADAQGNRIEYAYDAQGNRTEVAHYDSADEKKFWVRYDYNDPNWPGKHFKTINPDDTYTAYSYTTSGMLETVTDANGRVTDYAYDILQRAIRFTAPGNTVTQYGYDTHDNLVSVTDAENQATYYSYDDLNKLVTQVSSDTGTSHFVYDAAGNLTLKIDANGNTTNYDYDARGRLTGISFADSSQNIIYTYDEGPNGKGHLTGMTDPGGSYIFRYDVQGRLVEEEKTIGGVDYLTAYVYDAAGELSGIAYPGGRLVSYERDISGKVNRITTTHEGVSTTLTENIDYLPFGPLNALTYGNGMVMNQIFDQRYRLLQKHTAGIQDLTFGMDAVGNILSITDQIDPAKSQLFGFDDRNRLTSASGIYGSIGYTYDKVGNRLSINQNGTTDIYSYLSGTNKLSEAGGIPYTYDDNGNPTTMGTKALTYNYNNRLIHVAENGSVLGGYTYNALGQRVVKASDGQTTIYMYDQQGNLIAEADDEGNINKEYIWLEGRLLAAVKSGKIQIEAMVDIDPDTLNLNSKGNWITAYIDLPEGYDIVEVDPATIMLNRSVLAGWVQVGDEDGDGIPELMVKFDRGKVSDILQPGDEVEIVVEGEADTFLISGTDTIRVISKGKKNNMGQGTATATQAVAAFSTATESNRVVFYHLDHLGTPQVMTDEDGEVVWLADYLPFGEVDVTVEVVENKFRFAGQYFDEETGLHYNYQRYYDPKTGRYLTPDPIGLLGGINLYTYVLNNPINDIDPLGLHGIMLFGRGPWYVNIPRTLRQIPRNIRQKALRNTECKPKYEQTRPPTPEEMGAPPQDQWWQQDPMKQDPFKPKPNYNPQKPPKVGAPGTTDPYGSDPNAPYDPIFNPGGDI